MAIFVQVVVAWVVAIFQPISRVLVSVISPTKTRDQQSQRRNSQSDQQPQQNKTTNTSNRHRSGSENKQDHHENTSITNTTTSQDDDDDDNDADFQSSTRMAPPLQNQPSAANRANGNKSINTDGQPPAKVALPRKGPPKGGCKQENATVHGDAVNHSRSNDFDGANATKNGRKYRSVGEEQAEENRHDQLTLPPPALDADTVKDSVVGEVDEEPEDPATAADRAYHTGFMNQALDMVCLFAAPPPRTFRSAIVRGDALARSQIHSFHAICQDPFQGPISIHSPLTCIFHCYLLLLRSTRLLLRFKSVFLIAQPPTPASDLVLPSSSRTSPHLFLACTICSHNA